MKKGFLFVFSITILGILLLFIWHNQIMLEIRKEYEDNFIIKEDVYVRKFPFNFKAAIAICSDVDRTENIDEFIEIQRFLNTKEITSLGEGVGLEIGNSFLMYEEPNYTISYFNSSSETAAVISKFIKSGTIDVMHSFGKKEGFSRNDAIRAIAELEKNNLKVNVWVDHTISADNMGDDVTFGTGDHPDSSAYHADLTLKYGIKFAWLGRVTMIVGQEVPPDVEQYLFIFDSVHFIKSISNMLKEISKQFVACLSSRKYLIHKKNKLVEIRKLDDGQKIYEFIRFDNHWEGVSKGATSKGLGQILSEKTISRLKSRGGYMIVYTHLGMNEDCKQVICENTIKSLRMLEREFNDGEIFITTTSNLLNYYIINKHLNWTVEIKDQQDIRITIKSVEDPVFGSFIPTLQQLNGITFSFPSDKKIEIYLNHEKINSLKRNDKDQNNQASITITNDRKIVVDTDRYH